MLVYFVKSSANIPVRRTNFNYIIIKMYNNKTIVTICNYSKYK